MRVINQRWRTVASRAARATAIVAAIVTTALAASVSTLAAQKAEIEKTIQQRVLANGLEVIVVPTSGVPIATVELVVKNGAFTQTPEYAGLAHLFEHMFFKANDTLPRARCSSSTARRISARCSTRPPAKNWSATT